MDSDQEVKLNKDKNIQNTCFEKKKREFCSILLYTAGCSCTLLRFATHVSLLKLCLACSQVGSIHGAMRLKTILGRKKTRSQSSGKCRESKMRITY